MLRKRMTSSVFDSRQRQRVSDIVGRSGQKFASSQYCQALLARHAVKRPSVQLTLCRQCRLLAAHGLERKVWAVGACDMCLVRCLWSVWKLGKGCKPNGKRHQE